jgi:hydroxymethylpyrimidine pyrophosphatase-like HAD family hydrolase
MRYYALATDFDGTIASAGRVAEKAFAALQRLHASGRRAILITGRRLDDLLTICPRVDVFDCVVAENGGLLYWPATRATDILAAPPPSQFVEALRERQISPMAIGHVVVATAHPNEHAVLDVIREQQLELQIIFNGNEVMVLPPRINKGSGLEAALRKLGLSSHEVVGIGNAANDHSFLQLCELSVAVADAAPTVKASASFTAKSHDGQGVIEVIDELIATDLSGRTPTGAAECIVLGKNSTGDDVELPPYGHNVLIVGPSASGKSTLATGLIERLMEKSYQVCIIDPEGDYGTVDGVTTLGSRMRAPEIHEVVNVLRDPAVSLVVNLLGVPYADRPHFAIDLFSQIHALRVSTGRPHWVIIDEVHHLLPASWAHARNLLPQRLGETILITMRAADVVHHLIGLMDVVVAVGPSPRQTFEDVARTLRVPTPSSPADSENRSDAVVWFRSRAEDPLRFTPIPAQSERFRHLRKYAEGDLGHRSFFFRGPEKRLNLRAWNLTAFCDLLTGIDDETLLFHLRAGHYSAWFRRVIGDDDLAAEADSIAALHVAPGDIRRLMIDAIDRRYVLRR